MNDRDNILGDVIDKLFINKWCNHPEKGIVPQLELQITYDCNLACEYCYVHRYGKDLYPFHLRDRDTILKNLDIFLSYLLSYDNLKIIDLLLFSGEIWQSDFGYEVLERIYKKLCIRQFVDAVTIPSNSSFILHEEYLNKFKEYVKKYEDIGVKLILSCSVDGLIIEDLTRPFKGTQYVRDQAFYNKLFEFASEYKYAFHPMVSAYSIEKWIDNYDWWDMMAKKYGYDINKVMMLEVRNDDWTDDKIDQYLKFLNYVFDKTYQEFGYDKTKMCELIFKIVPEYKRYCNLNLITHNNIARCSIQKSLQIRLGDLAITPCHRLSYDKFLFGHFVVENDKVVGIKANNVELMLKIYFSNPTLCNYSCDGCAYSKLCILGCFGSQYENSKEIFAAIPCVCNLEKKKINFLIHKLTENGLIEHYKAMDIIDNGEKYKRSEILKAINTVLKVVESNE